MPFRKSFRSRSRRPRRRRRRKMRRTRRPRLDQEVKHASNTVSVAVSTTPFIRYLNVTAQGTDVSSRIGIQQLNVSLAFRWTYVTTVGGAAAPVLRLMIVHDKSPNGVPMVLGSILQDPTVPLTSFINMDNANRFRVLVNRRLTLGPADPAKQGSFFKKLNIKTRYSGPGGSEASLRTGAIVLLIVGVETTAATNPFLDFSSRVRFLG